jgi:hypothetical protein
MHILILPRTHGCGNAIKYKLEVIAHMMGELESKNEVETFLNKNYLWKIKGGNNSYTVTLFGTDNNWHAVITPEKKTALRQGFFLSILYLDFTIDEFEDYNVKPIKKIPNKENAPDSARASQGI